MHATWSNFPLRPHAKSYVYLFATSLAFRLCRCTKLFAQESKSEGFVDETGGWGEEVRQRCSERKGKNMHITVSNRVRRHNRSSSRLTRFVRVVTLTVVLAAALLPQQAAAATTFASGSLIIPMDTDRPRGNHTAFNQNSGMWKAYGLVYKLLQNGIPVHWAIWTRQGNDDDIDFTRHSVKDKRPVTALGSWDYRGGPFIIDSANAAAAHADHHGLVGGEREPAERARGPGAGFTADVRHHAAQRPAHRERGDQLRVSRSPTTTPPGSRTRTAMPGRPPRRTSSTRPRSRTAGCSRRASACSASTTSSSRPHNSGYAYSLTDPTNLGTRTYAQLDTFVNQGGGWTALCHSISSNENYIADLTRNGSAAVKALFKTSLPGGKPGGFLTTNGFPLRWPRGSLQHRQRAPNVAAPGR